MSKLRKFIKVSYNSAESAKNALSFVDAKYFSGTAPSQNFNRVEGNSVFIERSGRSNFDDQMKKLLLSLSGALPENCHVCC